MQSARCRRLPCAVVVLHLATSWAQSAELRTWTDTTGKFKVEAELVSVDDEIVLLKSKEGKTLRVPLARLSQADREYLDAGSKKEPTNPFEEVAKPAAVTTKAIAALKRKLNGKIDFDVKAGVVTITYSWSSKNQLRDFAVEGKPPAIAKGSLLVPPGASMRHAIEFKEVTIAAPVLIPIMQGTLVKTSGGAVAALGGASPNTMYLGNGKETKGLIVPEDQRKGLQMVRLVVSADQLGFEYGDARKPSQLVLGESSFRAGAAELHGGDAGFQYGTLVMSGKLDEQWLAKFVASKE